MENEPDCSAFVSGKTVIVPGVVSSWDIDKITAEWEADPLTQRLIFFNILKTQFSLEELGELAHNLGLSLDDLPPGSRGVKAQELIGYFERRGQKRNLLEAAAKARKDIPWR
jgi:hypothetical protein